MIIMAKASIWTKAQSLVFLISPDLNLKLSQRYLAFHPLFYAGKEYFLAFKVPVQVQDVHKLLQHFLLLTFCKFGQEPSMATLHI